MRTLLLLLALATAPGCLAAAAGGIAYMVGKGKQSRAETRAARLKFIAERRKDGATDAEILRDIEMLDPVSVSLSDFALRAEGSHRGAQAPSRPHALAARSSKARSDSTMMPGR